MDSRTSDVVVAGIDIGPTSVAVYGTGSQAVIAEEALGTGYTVVVFIDYESRFTSLRGIPVLSPSALLPLADKGLKLAHSSLPTPALEDRAALEIESAGLTTVSAIHPSAVVSPTAKLGANVYVGPLAVIGPEAELDDYCRVLNGASVAHHTRLGRGVQVADGARIGGHVTIGAHSLLGLNAAVNFHLTIGERVTVNSGVAVYDHVPDSSIVRTGGEYSSRREFRPPAG
jgi:UDP-perosamine 4-acetyltransferase